MQLNADVSLVGAGFDRGRGPATADDAATESSFEFDVGDGSSWHRHVLDAQVAEMVSQQERAPLPKYLAGGRRAAVSATCL